MITISGQLLRVFGRLILETGLLMKMPLNLIIKAPGLFGFKVTFPALEAAEIYGFSPG